MKGMQLAENYFKSLVQPAFRKQFPSLYQHMAFGLAGPGSECYGFDDEFSRDHDWGPRVCIWVPDRIYAAHGGRLQKSYEALPGECCGFQAVQRKDTGIRRDGIISIPVFFSTAIGLEHPPSSLSEWLMLKDEQLAQCTNGRIFLDLSGEFSAFRKSLLSYYPKDVRLRKIISRCFMISQYGQYNLQRALKRQDLLAVEHAKAMFIHESVALAFLLERRYRPFYKWQFRALEDLPHLGKPLLNKLKQVHAAQNEEELFHTVENTASFLAGQVKELLQFSHEEAYFLQDIGFALQSHIEDAALRDSVGFVE